jgi:hypothetical protein
MAPRVTVQVHGSGSAGEAAGDAFQRLLRAWDGDELDVLLPSGDLSAADLLSVRRTVADRLWGGSLRAGQLALAPIHREAQWESCDPIDPTQRHQGMALVAAADILARLLGPTGVLVVHRED